MNQEVNIDTPPHALEAERGVLGCVLISPETVIPELMDKFVDSGAVLGYRA